MDRPAKHATAGQIESMIMARLHSAYPQCDLYIDSVVVTPAGEAGHWIADTVIRQGTTVPSDCYSIKNAITTKLRREYDLSP